MLNDLILQADGKILLGGRLKPLGKDLFVPLLRLFPDGSVDHSFDVLPENNIPTLADYYAYQMSIQPNGKILTCLNRYTPPSSGGGVIIIIIAPPPPVSVSQFVRFLGDGAYPPHRPLEVLAMSLSSVMTRVTWNDVSDETGYVVERNDNGSWVTVATLAADITTFDDPVAPGQINHSYRIRALNAQGSSSPSPEAAVVLPTDFAEFTVTATAPRQVDLAWSDVVGEWGYEVYRKNGSLTGYYSVGSINVGTLIPWIADFADPQFDFPPVDQMTRIAELPQGSTSYSDTSVDTRQTYTYVILARNLAGTRVNIGSAITTPSDLPPSVPQRFTANSGAQESIVLSWRDTVWEDSYVLEWSPPDETNWQTLAVLPANTTSYVHGSGLPAGQTFHYRLRAGNLFGGTSSPSPTTGARVEGYNWVPGGAVDPTFHLGSFPHSLYHYKKSPQGALFALMDYYSTYQLKKINPDGSPAAFSTAVDSSNLYDYLPLADGKILVCGDFQGRVRRLNVDGSQDWSFAPPAVTGWIYHMFPLINGKILLGGSFTLIGNQASNGIALMNPNGTLVPGFSMTGYPAGQSGPQQCIEQPDGRLVVSFGGMGLVRLTTSGSPDASFGTGGTVSFNQNIYALALQPDGKILAGGSFSALAGGLEGSHNRLLRLDGNGVIDPSFDTGSGFPIVTKVYPGSTMTSYQSVRSLAVDGEGRILVAGDLLQYDSQKVNGLLRLLPDGTLDTSLKIDTNPQSSYGASIVILNDDGTFYCDLTGLKRYYSQGAAGAGDQPEITSTRLSASSFDLEWEPNGATSSILEVWNPATMNWNEAANVTGTTRRVIENVAPGVSFSYRIKSLFGGDAGPVYSSSYVGRAFTLFEQWKVSHGLAADILPNQPFHGIPLLTRYALGLSPESNEPAKLPKFQIDPSTHIGVNLTKAAPELDYVVEYSEDLVTWSTEMVSETVEASSGQTAFHVSTMGKSKLYVRLRIFEP